MIIVLDPKIKSENRERIHSYFIDRKFEIHESQGANHLIFGIVGDTSRLDENDFKGFDGVDSVFRVSESYKLCSRNFQPTNTVIDVKGIPIGGNDIVVIAGPCSVENETMINELSDDVFSHGANIYRGGTFKPRSSPYTFQGLEKGGIDLLSSAGKRNNMPIVTEITDINTLDYFIEHVDIIQVGARNMYNYTMLRQLAKINKPILLKRGLSATIDEWLNSAEYIISGGNRDVILCERGFRTYEKSTRFTLDLSSIPVIKKKSHLPIIVDPSHAMGNRTYVCSMARAAVAAGADGIMVEVHNDPDKALSDGPQSLYPDQFKQLMSEISIIAKAIGRNLYK